MPAPQLTVSPDGRFALALVFGAKPAFFSQANVVVVDIHSARRVSLVCCGTGQLQYRRGQAVAHFADGLTLSTARGSLLSKPLQSQRILQLLLLPANRAAFGAGGSPPECIAPLCSAVTLVGLRPAHGLPVLDVEPRLDADLIADLPYRGRAERRLLLSACQGPRTICSYPSC